MSIIEYNDLQDLYEEIENLQKGKEQLKKLLKETCLERDRYMMALEEIANSQEPWEPQRTIALKALQGE